MTQQEAVARIDELVEEARRADGDRAIIVRALAEAQLIAEEFALPFYGFGPLVNPVRTAETEGFEDSDSFDDSDN